MTTQYADMLFKWADRLEKAMKKVSIDPGSHLEPRAARRVYSLMKSLRDDIVEEANEECLANEPPDSLYSD
jgi:hypothetical protein